MRRAPIRDPTRAPKMHFQLVRISWVSRYAATAITILLILSPPAMTITIATWMMLTMMMMTTLKLFRMSTISILKPMAAVMIEYPVQTSPILSTVLSNPPLHRLQLFTPNPNIFQQIELGTPPSALHSRSSNFN